MVDLAVSPRADSGWHSRGRGDGAGGLPMAIRADKSHLGEESSTRRFGITAVMSDLLGAGLLLVPPAVGTVNGGALLTHP